MSSTTTIKTNIRLDEALRLAGLGYRVFPLRAFTKVPWQNTHGVHDATTDDAKIRQWWDHAPNANLALATGEGMLVLDIDAYKEGCAFSKEHLAELELQSVDQPRARTPRGGIHLFYRAPEGISLTNSAGKIGKGLDIRSDGGFVVAPPSRFVDRDANIDGVWEWYKDGRVEVAPGELPPCPDWLIDKLKAAQRPEPAKGTEAGQALVEPIKATPERIKRARAYAIEAVTKDPAVQGEAGQSKLLWISRVLVRGLQLPDDAARKILIEDYNPRCDPPWEPHEYHQIDRKIQEARCQPFGKPVGWLLNPGNGVDLVGFGVRPGEDQSGDEESQPPVGPAPFRPFPVEVFPEQIRSYVVACATSIGCDESFVALPMLSGLASAIGNTRKIKIKRAWTEPAIIWAAIIAEPSKYKSPALELALLAIQERGRFFREDHAKAINTWETAHSNWEIQHTAWKQAASKAARSGNDFDDAPEPPERPVCSRTWTDDTTTEALVSKLQENPRGLLMIRDELSGWFNFDRYAGGRGGGDVEKWLRVFGGRELVVDRKTSGTEFVSRASVSIAGGIQPEILRRALAQENRENGLASRLLFAMPPRRQKMWTDSDVDECKERAMLEVFDSLYGLDFEIDSQGNQNPKLVPMNRDAQRLFKKFVNEHGFEQHQRVGDEAAAWGKLEGYAARFALVIHLTRAASKDPTLTNPDMVDEASIEAGVKLVRWFTGEVERVYAALDGDEDDRERRQLDEWVTSKGGSVTAKMLQDSRRKAYPKAAMAEKALNALVEADLGKWEHSKPGAKGGRTSKRFVQHGQKHQG